MPEAVALLSVGEAESQAHITSVLNTITQKEA
jgi:hypothetical protein